MRRRVTALLGFLVLVSALLTASAAFPAASSASSASMAQSARPDFKLPFPCGQKWTLTTYRGHNPDDKKLDMFRVDGSTTGSTVAASAPGRVHQWFDPGGIEIDHGNGWFTVYIHMSARAAVGTTVSEGSWVGTAGSVGTGTPHLHYEQLYDYNGDGDGDTGEMVYPVIQGTEYRLHPDDDFPTVTSQNACGSGDDGKYWVDTFADAEGYNDTQKTDSQGLLFQGTHYVYCKAKGVEVRVGDQYNTWWLKTDLDETFPGKNGRNAYVSAYYLKRWGNDVAKDNSGKEIPDCKETDTR